MIKQRRVSVADAQRGFESLCRYQKNNKARQLLNLIYLQRS